MIEFRIVPIVLDDTATVWPVVQPMLLPMSLSGSEQSWQDKNCCHVIRSPADRPQIASLAWTVAFCRRSKKPYDESEEKCEGDDGGTYFGAPHQMYFELGGRSSLQPPRISIDICH